MLEYCIPIWEVRTIARMEHLESLIEPHRSPPARTSLAELDPISEAIGCDALHCALLDGAWCSRTMQAMSLLYLSARKRSFIDSS